MCFSEICVHNKFSSTYMVDDSTSGPIPKQSSRVPTEDQNSYSTREPRTSP